MAIETKIELDVRGFKAAVDEALRSTQATSMGLAAIKSDMAALSSEARGAASVLAMMDGSVKDVGTDAARAGSEIDKLGDKVATTGDKAQKSAVSLRGMVGIAAGLAGFALTVADPMLRASGHDKAADYMSGTLKGAGSGAMMGSVAGPWGMAAGAVIGGAAGAAGVHMSRSADQKREAEELAKALTGVGLSSDAAKRGILALDNASQAEGVVKALREEIIRLDAAMAAGLESGPVADEKRGALGQQVGLAEAHLGDLRAAEAAKQRAAAAGALQGYGQDRQEVASRVAFAASVDNAGTAAEKQELVNMRMVEFTDRANELREALADVAVQADATQFNALLASLKDVDAEGDRLRAMRIGDDKPAPGRRDAPIASDALTRIGGGSGVANAPLNAVERNTSQMARLLQSVDRHLANIATKNTGTTEAVWAI